MAKRRKIIVSAVAVTAAFAVMCTAGFTLAASTSVNSSNGSLTTADLNLAATAKNIKVYSAVKASPDTPPDKLFYDKNDTAYQYEQSVMQGDEVGVIEFTHGGGVRLDEEGKSVEINGICPGDKIEFDIEVTSTSSISFNYRTELWVEANEEQKLLENLRFTAASDRGEIGLVNKDVDYESSAADDPELVQAVLTDYTEITTVSASQTTVENVKVTIEMPIDKTEGQGDTVKFFYVATGIQNTVSQEDVVRFEMGGGAVGFKTVAEAVEYAKEHGITEIPVIGDTLLEEGTIVIDDAMHFTGVKKENGEYPTLNGARFVIDDLAAATFENINFTGYSYIDVTKATALEMTECNADIRPVMVLDEEKDGYVADSAFIVSGTGTSLFKLTLKDSNIVSGRGAAVSLNSPLYTGSVISGNTFGAEERPYDGAAAVVLSGVYDEDTVISVENNTLYANQALSLGASADNARYTVVSKNNTAYGLTDNVFVSGAACAAFVDSGSKIGERALLCSDIAYKTLAFGGVDVKLNSLSYITEGKVAPGQITVNEIFTKYTEGPALKHNAIALYNDGGAYAYLNASATGENGFIIDQI